MRRLLLLATTAALLITATGLAETKRFFTVTALGYRVIPYYRTTTQQIPGVSRTNCYGAGTFSGRGGFAVACSTVSTLPETRTDTSISQIEIFNEVESEGMVYTIRCTANWLGSQCSQLRPGDVFEVEVDNTTMWVHARQGGNLGKPIKPKYQMLDLRPREGSAPTSTPLPSAPTIKTDPARLIANADPTPLSTKTEKAPRTTDVTNAVKAAAGDVTATPATIWFYRTKSSTDSMLNPTIYSRGQALAKIEKGQFFALSVPPGTYYFSFKDNPKAGSEAWVTVASGQRAFFKVRYSGIKPVANAEAMEDLKKLKPIDSENVRNSDVLSKSPF